MTTISFSLTEAPQLPPKIGLNPKGQDLEGRVRRYRSRGSAKDQNTEPLPNNQLSINVIKQIFSILNPSSMALEQSARESNKYKETLDLLNQLDGNIPVTINISLSYRNLDRSLKTIPDQSTKDLISVFFKNFTSKLGFIFSKENNNTMFSTISLNFPISHVPDIMAILPIFYKIDLGSNNFSEKYTVYGISKLDKSYEIIQNMYRSKKSNEELESAKDKSFSVENDEIRDAVQTKIAGIDQEIKADNERFDNMSFDKRYDFINLPKKS